MPKDRVGLSNQGQKNTNLGMGKLFEALGLSTEANGLRAENQLSNKVVPEAFFICCMVTALLPPAQLKSIHGDIPENNTVHSIYMKSLILHSFKMVELLGKVCKFNMF